MADEDVAQTVAGLRPIIDWSADLTRSFSRFSGSSITTGGGAVVGGGTSTDAETNLNIGLTGDLLLYDFGRTDLQISAAKETVLATRQTLVSIEQQVLLRAVTAYMDVQRRTEFVELRKNNLERTRESLRAAQNRFELGDVTRTDVAQAEAQLASGKSALAAAQGDLERAKEEFISAVGRAPGDLRTPADLPDLGDSVAAAKSVAMRRHPDLREAQHEVAAAEFNIRVAEAAMRPTVNLTGRLGATEEVGGSSFSQSGSVGVAVTGPIYRGGRLSAAKRQAIARRDSALAALHLAKLQVRQDVGNAFANLRAARASLQASREEVRAARVAFRGVRAENRVGARTTLDVLDTEQDLLDAEANLISAQADLYTAAYAVLAATGQLTARDLRLAVKTYDPQAYYNLAKEAPVPSSERGRKLDKVLRALGKQ